MPQSVPDLLTALRSGGSVIAAELRPPRAELAMREGMDASALETCPSELEGVKRILEWSRAGDVLVMPVHERTIRAETLRLISH